MPVMVQPGLFEVDVRPLPDNAAALLESLIRFRGQGRRSTVRGTAVRSPRGGHIEAPTVTSTFWAAQRPR